MKIRADIHNLCFTESSVGSIGKSWIVKAAIGFSAVLHSQYKILRIPGTDTGGGPDYLTGDFRNPETETDGFPTDSSWGYRFALRFDYNNAIGAVTISPRLGWAHDVNGTTPGPGGAQYSAATM